MIDIERLKERLAATNLTPNAASQKAGLGRDYVRDILRGRIREPSALRIHRLAAALECSEAYLLGRDEDTSRLSELLHQDPDDRRPNLNHASSNLQKILSGSEPSKVGSLVDVLDTVSDRTLVEMVFSTFNSFIFDYLEHYFKSDIYDLTILIGEFTAQVVDDAYERRALLARLLGMIDGEAYLGAMAIGKVWSAVGGSSDPHPLGTPKVREALKPLLSELDADLTAPNELVRFALIGATTSLLTSINNFASQAAPR